MSVVTLVLGAGPRFADLVRDRSVRYRRPAGWPADLAGARTSPFWHGRIETEADAQRVLVAALGGAEIVAAVPAWTPAIDRLLDDLRRVAEVVIVSGEVPGGAILDAEDAAILGLLADGLTRIEVARSVHLSPRSLDRRLAAIKLHLGARTIAQAVDAARRLG